MANVKGLSLIEVVAALALLATSATVLLVAQGRSLAHWRETRLRETAAMLASEKITAWKLEPRIEPPAEGEFEGHPHWRWRRHARPYAEAPARLREVRLDVRYAAEPSDEKTVDTFTWLERRDDR